MSSCSQQLSRFLQGQFFWPLWQFCLGHRFLSSSYRRVFGHRLSLRSASFPQQCILVQTGVHGDVFIELSVEGDQLQRIFVDDDWNSRWKLDGSSCTSARLDMSFQRWPLPLIYGASIGHIASNVLLIYASIGHDDRAKRS